MVVDRDVNELEADAASAIRLSLIASDPMPYCIESPKLFDVEVDELAGCLAFIAGPGWQRLKGR